VTITLYLLYMCAILSRFLEGHRLRVFDNRVLRRMLVFNWEEVTGR